MREWRVSMPIQDSADRFDRVVEAEHLDQAVTLVSGVAWMVEDASLRIDWFGRILVCERSPEGTWTSTWVAGADEAETAEIWEMER